MVKKEDLQKVKATKVADVLYVDAPRSKFVPAYVYYLLKFHECTKVSFGMSLKEFKIEDLKGKDDWNDV